MGSPRAGSNPAADVSFWVGTNTAEKDRHHRRRAVGVNPEVVLLHGLATQGTGFIHL